MIQIAFYEGGNFRNMMHNPHDKFFKETFSYPEVVRDFVKHFLPEEILAIIDVTTIVPVKETFIQKELEEFYSDLLFEVDFKEGKGYLYFLFEHKSFRDESVAFQFLNYMKEIWGRQIERDRVDLLAPILPILFYQGKKAWERPKTLIDWFAEEDLARFRPFIPQFEFLFFNIASHDCLAVDTIKLKTYLEVIRFMNREDMENLYRAIAELEGLKEQNYFETVLIYVLHVSESVSVEDLKERLTMEGGRKLMTIAEKLRQEGRMIGREEGRRIGIKEGIEEGKAEALKVIVQNMLTLGKSEQEIHQLTGLSDEEVKRIIAKLNR